MKLRATFIGIFFMLLGLLSTPASAQPQFPTNPNNQWIIDQADILSPVDEQKLNTKLEQFEKTNGHQLVVLTISSLDGYDVADYGYQAGRHYAIGDKEKDDGVLLVVAPNDRKVHIAVGYGLEPILTDAYSSLIINQAITPLFRQDDYSGGINAGVDQIIHQISLPAEEAKIRATKVQSETQSSDTGMAIFWIVIFLFFILPIIIGMMRGNRGRSHRNSPIVVWGPGFGSGYGGGGFSGGGYSSGGGFSGGFSGGGGGFSGGGGSFGGGGASGSW